MICSFYVATELKLSAPLFAKLATLFFWCRIVYPIPYVRRAVRGRVAAPPRPRRG